MQREKALMIQVVWDDTPSRTVVTDISNERIFFDFRTE